MLPALRLFAFVLLAGLPVVPAAAQAQGLEGQEERRVTLNVRETPLRSALELLFQGGGANLTVAPDVPNVTLTLNIKDQPLRVALRTLLRVASGQIPDLTYRVDQNVYVIYRRKPAAVTGRPVPPREPPAEKVEYGWLKIPLQRADLAAIAPALGIEILDAPPAGPGPGPRPLGSQFRITIPDLLVLGLRADNSLLAYGTPRAIQEFRPLVRLIDVPRRQVRVRLTAGDLTAAGQTLENTSLRLADRGAAGRLTAAIHARVNGDGTIELALDGTYLERGGAYPIRTTITVASGRAVEAFSLGKRGVRVRVSAEILDIAIATGLRGPPAPARRTRPTRLPRGG